MAEDAHPGYRYGVAQPALRMELSFTAAEDFDAALGAAWLRDRLGLSALPMTEAAQEDGPTSAALALAGDLYGEIARIGGLPVFSAGRLLPQTGQGAAALALPVVDTLPQALFIRLYEQALKLVTGPLQQPATTAAVAAVHALVDKLREDIRRQFSFAKPTVDVCRMASEQGVPWRYLGAGVFRIGWGARGRLLGGAAIDGDSLVGARICLDKHITAAILRQVGLPVPEHRRVRSLDEARAAATAIGWPVVVKPADQERSIGVSVNVRDEAALAAGFAMAAQASKRILVERQYPGTCHRIMVAGGEVLYTVERLAKCVIGDGQSTVAALAAHADAEQEALPPWSRLKPFPLDELALACLADAGLSPDSVPPAGSIAPLRPVGREDWGGHVFDRSAALHPDNARLAIAAAHACGLEFAGIDVITPDVSRAWHETGAVINEVNASPEFGVSVRTRPGAERIIPAIIAGDGRIPVHLVTGAGKLEPAALALQRQRGGAGERCHVTSGEATRDAAGVRLAMTARGINARCHALLLRRDVEGLIVVAPPAEIGAHGLAVDRLDSISVVGGSASERAALERRLRTDYPARS